MSPSSPSSLPQVRPRRWPWLLGWLVLTVYFLTPPRAVYDQTLDNSNYATYTYFLTHHFQWGADVLPMPGPLGFLIYGHTYSGELYGTRLIGDLLLKACFVILLLRLLFRAGPGRVRWVWLAAVVVMVPLVDDLLADFAILVATLVLLSELGPRLNRWSFLAAALLGEITLIKGNHPVTTAACFSAVLMLCFYERQWRGMAKLAATCLCSFLGCWLLAGQNPANISHYLQSTLQLSLGYNAAMGLDEAPVFTVAGLALVAGLIAVFAWAASAGSRQRRAVIALLVIAGFSFIKWKHGYVRADGHVYIFFTSVAVFTLTICLVSFTSLMGPAPGPLPARSLRLGLGLVTLVTGFAVIGAAEFRLPQVLHMGLDAPAALQRNARYLVHPWSYRAPLARQLELNRRTAQVPQIQNEVGRGLVDFFGFEEGLLFLNELNYRPRPMGGGTFNVFNAWVQDRNEAFVRDPRRAPPWEVLKLQTIDNRLPAADDGTTLRAILELYSPVLMQRDYLLLHRRESPPAPAAPVLLETRRVRPGETIVPPAAGAGRLLLFTVDAPLSAAGRIRAFFYRAPELTAKVVSAHHPHGEIFVLKPSMLQRPVILSPLLADNSDVLQLFSDSAGNPVRSLTLETQPGFATDALAVSFYSVPRPAKPESADVEEILTYRDHPLYNRIPLELVTQQTGITELNQEPITLVHAPGSITWDLKPGDQQVIFSYGMMPQSYLDGGTTDGVGFNVEVLWPPKDGRIIFRRLVRPLTVQADRGMQRVRVFLPPFEPGARLRIRTDTGPDNNGAYDQSYVTRLQIKQGPLVPEQFNGLGVVPVNGLLPHEAVAGVGNRPVYLIHAPGQVTLRIPPGARKVTCEIGLLPSAYQDGGHTDGVEYLVEAALPGGERRALFTRYLDPVHQPADRGSQTLVLSLPNVPSGSELVITTRVGPSGNRSWDQSYVAGVRFD